MISREKFEMMKTKGSIYESLCKYATAPSWLFLSLKSHFIALRPYDRADCAACIAGILPLFEVTHDSASPYLELFETIAESLRDSDFFAVFHHLLLKTEDCIGATPEAGLLHGLDAALGRALPRLQTLRELAFFSDTVPRTLLRAAAKLCSVAENCGESVPEAVRCVVVLFQNKLLPIDELEDFHGTHLFRMVAAQCEEEKLIWITEKIGQMHVSVGPVFSLEAEENSSSEESKAGWRNRTVLPAAPPIRVSLHDKVRPESMIQYEKWDSIVQSMRAEKSIKLKKAIEMPRIVASYTAASQEIQNFLGSCKEILSERATKNEFPKFELLGFLPTRNSLNEYSAIVVTEFENNVYNVLRLIDNHLTALCRSRYRPYEKAERVCGFLGQTDFRERFWVPYVCFKSINKRRPEETVTIRLFVNHMSLHYGGRLLSKYFDFDSRAETVCTYIGSWALSHGVVSPESGYLSLYAIYLMVIFYLQTLPEPVLDSIQAYCETKTAVPVTKDIPSLETMKAKPTRDHYKTYPKELLRLLTFDASFLDLDVKKMREELGYPRNKASATELIAGFFKYFSAERPEGPCKKMSVRRKGYVDSESPKDRAFAFVVEDPLCGELNVAYSVLNHSKEHTKILEEFKKGYESLMEYTSSEL